MTCPDRPMTRAERAAAQDRRRDQLTQLRLQRPLTDDELREEERLENTLYARIWRAAERETQARLEAKIAAQAAQHHKQEEFA